MEFRISLITIPEGYQILPIHYFLYFDIRYETTLCLLGTTVQSYSYKTNCHHDILKVIITKYVSNCHSPVQPEPATVPSPEYPLLHVHVKDPSVLSHTVLVSQRGVTAIHSLISRDTKDTTHTYFSTQLMTLYRSTYLCTCTAFLQLKGRNIGRCFFSHAITEVNYHREPVE